MQIPLTTAPFTIANPAASPPAGSAAMPAPAPSRTGIPELANIFKEINDEMNAACQKLNDEVARASAAEAAGARATGGARGDAAFTGAGAKPHADLKRPAGDTRSAQEIINDTPVLKQLSLKSGIHWDGSKMTDKDKEKGLLGLEKALGGDYKTDPDAAYRFAKVLEYIDTSAAKDGSIREGTENGVGDANVTGFTKDWDARHGTEAALLADFCKYGYSALPDNHCLTQTNDRHVRADGTNKDNFQYAMGEIGRVFKWVPGVGSMFSAMGESKGGFGGMLSAGLGSVANTAMNPIGAIGEAFNPADTI